MLRRFHLRARKRLGQHFLIDSNVLGQIIAAADISSDDLIIEIGPGLGFLTQRLAEPGGRVLAIELDDKLAVILRQILVSRDNITVINADIMDIDLASLVTEHSPSPPPVSYKLVANLPYYITAPVLRHCLESAVRPSIMVVMVQKEVAEAIVSGPGQMSLLSISVQFYGRPTIVDYVPASCFYPAPEVVSAILKIEPYTRPPVPVSDINGFFSLVRAGFTASRKQLVNSLAQGLKRPKTEVASLLARTGIAGQRRAETLSLDEWARLWQSFTEIPHGNNSGTGQD